MDKIFAILTKYGNKLVILIATVMVVIFGLYGTLMLWDMFRTEMKAFASYDLLQYRPNIEEDEPPYLDELIKINKDTAGWVTIYGTNIDYPVMQGKNDTEYLNKDPMGNYSVSGSVFMATINSKDFSDPYTLIYGHHMDNGSMFGDIDKFRKDKDFFYNKNDKRFEEEEGVLIMQNKVWNLKVFAVMEVSAYDHDIYRSDKPKEDIPKLLEYIKKKAKYERDVGDVDKILALSTCVDATSYERTVLMCKMEKRTTPLPTREEEPLTPHRKAVGHPMAGAYWALLDLITLLGIAYLLIGSILRKAGKKTILTELAGTAAAITLFVLTQDPRKPIQAVDIWTPVMLAIFIAMICAGKYFLKKNDTEKDNEEIAK